MLAEGLAAVQTLLAALTMDWCVQRRFRLSLPLLLQDLDLLARPILWDLRQGRK